MPDHWHALVEIGETDSLSHVVRRIKGATARTLNGDKHAGRVWAPGFHDHALRNEEDLRVTARYVIMNPVRAGLVSRIGVYSFWDAVWLHGKDRD